MKIDSFKCDSCNRQKGETNNWYKFRSYPDTGNGTEFIVNPFHSEGTDYPNTKHLCSDACVIKTVQEWLSAQTEALQKGE
jgi:hypothetical protein